MGTEYIIWWVGYYGMMSFLPVLDAVLSELERQFSARSLMHNYESYSSLCSRIPSFVWKPIHHIAPLADSYGLDKSALPMECSLAQHMGKILMWL